MVMPRSRSRSMVSSTCSIIWRCERAAVTSSRRSASVDLPWSMCAMIEKFRMNLGSMRYDAVRARRSLPSELSHMSYSNIRFEADQDGVALVTVSRPEKLNALNRDTVGELADAFQRVREDVAIRSEERRVGKECRCRSVPSHER